MSDAMVAKNPLWLPRWARPAVALAAPLLPLTGVVAAAGATRDKLPPKIPEKVANLSLAEGWRRVESRSPGRTRPRAVQADSAPASCPLRSPKAQAAQASGSAELSRSHPKLHLLNPVGWSMELSQRTARPLANLADAGSHWAEQTAKQPGQNGFVKLSLGKTAGVLDGIGSLMESSADLAGYSNRLMDGDPKTYSETLKTTQSAVKTGLYCQGEFKERAGRLLCSTGLPGLREVGQGWKWSGGIDRKYAGGEKTGEGLAHSLATGRRMLSDKVETLRKDPWFEGSRLWSRIEFEAAMMALPMGETIRVGTGTAGRMVREVPEAVEAGRNLISREPDELTALSRAQEPQPGRAVARQVSAGGRNTEPLTEAQKAEVCAYAESLGQPAGGIHFSESFPTSHAHGDAELDMLIIGPDVLPAARPGRGTLSANSRISGKGAVAHEMVGHREAALARKTQVNEVLEEVQASIRAARFGEGLTSTERTALLRDAIARLHNNGLRARDVKDILWIQEREL